MPLNVLDELGDEDIASIRQRMVLDQKAAAADGGDHAVKEEEGLYGRQHIIEHLHDGEYVLVCDRDAVLPGQQLHTVAFGKAFPVNLVVIDDSAHCAATKAVEEVEQHRRLAVDSCREC